MSALARRTDGQDDAGRARARWPPAEEAGDRASRAQHVVGLGMAVVVASCDCRKKVGVGRESMRGWRWREVGCVGWVVG